MAEINQLIEQMMRLLNLVMFFKVVTRKSFV
ncbi:hypothetical protein EV196_108266 [Mariniflexile fucanivorans]|uniref:Uncharacterized protein n=1 Tax=Mariniflexile fucanivorans TaxID=264023 RepID=A0A4R1RDW7_9FLAO|nr:hypothetical protein EV196_108266 [Mariniflexile fucanivorans]